MALLWPSNTSIGRSGAFNSIPSRSARRRESRSSAGSLTFRKKTKPGRAAWSWDKPVAPLAGVALLAARHGSEERTVVRVGRDCSIGKEGTVTVIAGPCSIESESQLDRAAAMVHGHGLHVLRGGAFKPRTGPYCFQGLGLEGLRLLRKVAEHYGLATVSEAMTPEHVDLVGEYCDVIQIGARNMQNYDLLRRAGQAGKPVLLKRGLAATLDELAAGRRARPVGRQRPGHSLRARHPHV